MAYFMLNVLKNKFGFDTFRPYQKEIIENVLLDKDTLVLMPTGGGKSICYQLPALLKAGTAIVISPLISLMKDQVDGLQANGIEARAMNSANNETENMILKRECVEGKVKLLYISPERLMMEKDYLLKDMKISLFAIDEAHCISQWGHDFRPEYTQLKTLREQFPEVPIVALTATADKITRQDIIEQLSMKEPNIFISSFDRPNLNLEVKKGFQQREKNRAILEFIVRHPGQCGIIYCTSREKTTKVAEMLVGHGINAMAYHAGMNNRLREKVQNDFINDRIQVICATIAFGMGIDKSNVRWVIHYNIPKSIESFYQEIGRAGRDGMKSDTLLFYSLGDLVMLTKFAIESGQQEINLEKLNRMQQYAESDICRRRILLNYFGEIMEHDCGNCDVCRNPPERFDGTIIVQKALSAIARTDEQIGTHMLIAILRGNFLHELTSKKYHELKTFGVGRDVPQKDWMDYILQMLNLGYIEIAYNENNHLKITPSGEKVLYGKERAMLVTIKREEKEQKPKGRKNREKTETKAMFNISTLSDEGLDKLLFEKLRVLRKQLADEQGIPPYIVFSDKTLQLLSVQKPTTIEAFGNVSGIGEYKRNKYGKLFVETIKKLLEE